MQNLIREILLKHIQNNRDEDINDFAEKVARDIVVSQEFVAYSAQRVTHFPDLGLGEHVNLLWRKVMTAATDAFAASLATLKTQLAAAGGGLTADQVNAQIQAAVTPFATQVAAIAASEQDDASKVTDLNAIVAQFEAAFPGATTGGTSSGSGTSTGTPTPTPAPTQAPGSSGSGSTS